MKQLGRGIQTVALHGVLLYLEDFLSILDSFQKSCDDVKVTADSFELENPETETLELKSCLHRSEVFKIEIVGNRLESYKGGRIPRFMVSLSLDGKGGSGFLTHDMDDPSAEGLKAWILKRLTHRRLAKLMGERPWLSGILLVAIPPVLMTPVFVFGYFYHQRQLPMLSLTIAWGSVAIWLVSRLFRQKTVAVLRLEHRSERTNFFVRNKDPLVLTIITALLTAVVTLVTTLYVQSRSAPAQEQPTPTTRNAK